MGTETMSFLSLSRVQYENEDEFPVGGDDGDIMKGGGFSESKAGR